jgi:hypothetical protein
MRARIAFGAVAILATMLAAPDAFAKGGKGRDGKRNETIELVRPADAPDPDARGTVEVGRNGGDTTLTLTHLDRRTTYEIRDSATGALLGSVRTNRKGKATFNLTKSAAKAAQSGGSDTVDAVDVVDPQTGDPVLTGDVTPPEALPQFGYDSYTNDAGDAADAYLASDPDFGDDTISVTYSPAKQDANGYSYYEFTRSTSEGDELPLGAASATEFAGRAFEIRGADGVAVIAGNLPALEDAGAGIDDPVFGDDDGGDWGRNPWDDGSAWDDWSGDWSGSDDWTGDWSDWGAPSNTVGARHGAVKAKAKGKKHHGRAKDDAATGFRLFIADANGDLQLAGDMTVETVDYGGDGGDGGGGCYGFGIIVIVLPGDYAGDPSAFDNLGDLLAGLFGGCGCNHPTTGGGDTNGGDPSTGGAGTTNRLRW